MPGSSAASLLAITGGNLPQPQNAEGPEDDLGNAEEPTPEANQQN